MARPKSQHRPDVLVAGGGIAGVFAALGAAKRGLGVALIEPHNVLGGQGTAGGVNGHAMWLGDCYLVDDLAAFQIEPSYCVVLCVA